MLSKVEIADQIKKMLVENLKLPMQPEEIALDASLLGEGLGLDSVDLIELVALIYSEFKVTLTNEHRDYFENIGTMSEFIYNQRAKMGPV